MKVREFCREPGYSGAILLTWSFDAVFFERVVLQDLAAGEARVPLILADRRQVDTAIERWPDQVQHLGRRYVLETPSLPGDFHPKLMLRIGPAGGLVWISTGNVSAAGFGGNQELATAWKVGPAEVDRGAWVPGLLTQIDTWCSSPAAKDVLARVRSAAWVAEASGGPSVQAPILWAHPAATLAQQIEERWRGRRFDELRVTTGSTDAAGEFLLWAHRVFGVSRALVAVHASTATFDAARIDKLPVQVRFVEPSGKKTLHAKSYWFEGPDGAAALFGSANCSFSAWLRPLRSGGNVEAVAVFDHARRADWDHVLAAFEGSHASALDHLCDTTNGSGDQGTQEQPFHLVSVELDERSVRARAAPPIPASATVFLIIGDESLPLRPSHDGGHGTSWDGPLPERAGTSQPLFASLRIETDGGVITTQRRWVDQRRALQEASLDHRVGAVLPRFSRSLDTGEQRRFLEDLRLAMDTVLSDSTGFPDMPLRGPLRKEHPGGSDTSRHLDPRRVAVELGKTAAGSDHGSVGRAFPVSFGGVLQAFFPDAEEASALPVDSPELGSEEEDGSPPHPPTARTAPRTEPPDRARRRLVQTVDAYLRRLRDTAFADTCTATQLVQALAFPMAIAALGADSGWVDSGHAREWAVSAVTALLHERVPNSPHEGFLAHVAARYSSEGRSETFERIVGDGLLWTVCAMVLAGLKWDGLGARVQRGLLLRDVFHRQELVPRTDIEVLRHAARRFHRGDALKMISEELPRIDDVMERLESYLASNFERLLAEQLTSGGTHGANDPLWRPQIGWVFAVDAAALDAATNVTVRPWRPGQFLAGSKPKVVKAGFYVNARLALESKHDTVVLP